MNFFSHPRSVAGRARPRSFVRKSLAAAAWSLLILVVVCPGQSALAQDTTVIPPPPNPSHQPYFDPVDPHRAFDPKTGQNLVWDCNKKTWIDTKTGQGIGFSGRRDGNGDVIPPPPNPSHQPEFDPIDSNRAFDPKTGQNLVWDREHHTWKDTKTGKGIGFSGRLVKKACPPPRAAAPPPGPTVTPQIGMLFEPKISVGLGGSSGTSTYDSTGGQAPFNGDWSHSTGQVCGGATFYPGLAVGPARVGLDVNVCSGSNTFGTGDTTLFRIQRHGPGDVDLRASTKAIIDVLFKGEVPVGPSNNWFLSAGIGPTFRDLNLGLTSNQSFFGGGVPSVSATTWQTGLGVSAGLSTFVCPTCIAGNPLKVGVEGRARFFSPQSIDLRSPAFGFTETGSTGRTTDFSVMLTFGVVSSLGL